MRGVVAGMLLSLLLGCSPTDTPSETPSESTGLEREIRGFTLTETLGGKQIWALRSEYAWRIPSQNKVRLEKIELRFFDEQGRVKSRLTSLKGIVDESTGEMVAKERVKLVSLEGDTLTTDELTYLREKDLITGPGYVRLAKKHQILTGLGFESKPDLTNYKVYEDVHITVIDRGEGQSAGP